MANIYISYSKSDQAFVADLVKRLAKKKISATFDKTEIAPGDSIADSINIAIRNATYVLVVISPEYFNSGWRTKELEIALADEFEKKTTKVIPLLRRDTDIPAFIQSKQFVDFRTPESIEQSFPKLIEVLTSPQNQLIPSEEIDGVPVNLGSILKKAWESDEAQNMIEGIKSNVKAFIQQSVESPVSCDPVNVVVEPDLCFVVMPFSSEELDVVYEYFVKPEIEEKCGLRCVRGDDVFGSNVIMEDIRGSIEKARLILADLTGKNANVFYEVGIAHTLNKPVLLLSQSMNDIPFDLRHRRVLLYDYSPKGCKQLEKKIEENVNALIQ